MSTTYKALVESGACRMAYVWNVSGYPWAVCTDPALISLLANPESDSDAAYARLRIWGNTIVAGQYPAYDALIFPTLFSTLGPQTTKSKSVGFAEISGWTLRILDDHLGASWPHVAAGDEVRGLEGVHRVVSEFGELHGWGFLAGNVSTDAASIPITEESSGILYDRISALSGDYKMLWCNHECIAVTGIASGTEPEYSATIGGRGLFRSKAQYHYTDGIDQVHQKVADVPGSIAGHFCWLWAIPLTPEGGFYYDADGHPIIAMESSRCGVVSDDIVTDKGITTIKVMSPFDALKNKIDYGAADGAVAHIRKYTFSRGNSGTDFNDIWAKGQRPHLMLLESRPNMDPEFNVVIPNYWHPIPIWLCEKNSVITFDTLEEVVDAVNTELNALHLAAVDFYENGTIASSTQKSGDGTINNPYVFTAWVYEVSKTCQMAEPNPHTHAGYESELPYGTLIYADPVFTVVERKSNPMWYLQQLTGHPYSEVDGLLEMPYGAGKWSMAWGSVQLVLGLGLPVDYADSDTKYAVPSMLRNFDSELFTCSEKIENTMRLMPSFPDQSYNAENKFYNFEWPGYPNITKIAVASGLAQRPEIEEFLGSEDYFCAKYFQDWDWNSFPYIYFGEAFSEFLDGVYFERISKVFTNGKIHLAHKAAYPLLTMWADGNYEKFPPGSPVKIGSFKTAIEAWHLDNESLYLEMDETDVHEMTSSDTNSVSVGNALICIPAYTLEPGADALFNDSFDYDRDDPFAIRLNRDVSSSSVTDVIKAFLGATISEIDLPFNEILYPIPFFRDDAIDGMVSIIDWDSFEAMTESVLPFDEPSIPSKSFILRDAIDAELKFYGLSMYEEWSESHKQFIWRFRKFGNAVASNAIIRNRILDAGNLTIDSVAEDHLALPVFNKILVTYVPIGMDDEEGKIEVINRDVFSIIDRKALELKIDLLMTRLPMSWTKAVKSIAVNTDKNYVDIGTDIDPDTSAQITAMLVPYLYALSARQVTQQRGATMAARFKSTVGLEVSITDPASHMPGTHAAGLVAASASITEQVVDLTNGTIRISFVAADPSRIIRGYAPSCRVDVTDVTVVSGTEFTCIPEDHYSTSFCKDMFLFDCFDISNPDAPVERADSCGDYAVRVYAQDEPISADNPIVGTCRVIQVSGVWTMEVTCDTSKLPLAGMLTITYDEFDNCEPDQKLWLFFSDATGLIGTENRGGDVWR